MPRLLKNTLKRSLKSVGYELVRVPRKPLRLQSLESVHFLHIGKCAGSAINEVAKKINDESMNVTIIKHKHTTYLRDLSKNDKYFFSIRHPITRFKSGFYSRKRKGQPQGYVEWTEYDKIAFEEFEHANDLAEALFEEGEIGNKAFGAMKSLLHASQNQVDWFYSCGNFLRIRPPVWIIRQEKFVDDLKYFIGKIGAESVIADDVYMTKVHENNYENIPNLSDKAVSNLHKWYVQDFDFYRICDEWLNSNQQDKKTRSHTHKQGSL